MGLSDNLCRERFEANVYIVPFTTCHYWGGATGLIAERYGVSPSYISTLRHGGGLAKRIGIEKPKGRSDRRLSDEVALSIYNMAWKGVNSRALIAKLHGTTIQTVSDIKRGATYAGVTGHGRG